MMASERSERPTCFPTHLLAVSPQLPLKQCQWLSTDLSNIGWWNVGRFLSPLLFFFFQTSSIRMLWPVHVQKVPQVSEHLCPAMLQTSCDVCCAYQYMCPCIISDSCIARAVGPQKSLQLKTAWLCVRAAHHRLHIVQQVH